MLKKFDSWSKNVISGQFRFIPGEISAEKFFWEIFIAPKGIYNLKKHQKIRL